MQLRKTQWAIATACAITLAGCSVKPDLIAPAMHGAKAMSALEKAFQKQAPALAPISLPEAIERAIKYNLERRVQLLEEGLANKTLQTANMDLLPELAAQAGYRARNNLDASSSVSVLTGEESLAASTSLEKRYRTAGATMVWNVLDFGVSYVQAQQASDRVLIAGERQRKVTQNIAQDVRYAYWRALAAQRLLPRINQSLGLIEEALQASREAAKTDATAPGAHLEYQRDLLKTKQRVWSMREQLDTAKTELAVLMNMKPGTPFTLLDEEVDLVIPELEKTAAELEQTALENRPEVREETYNLRIKARDVKKAMLRLLPGFEITFGPQYNSNQYLVNNSWNQLGINLSWNLFNLLHYGTTQEEAKAAEQVAKARHMSVSMAVLAQLHLAYQRFGVAKAGFDIAKALREIENNIYKNTNFQVQADAVNPLLLTRANADLIVAQMNELLLYAELQNAYARIQNSIGVE